MKEQQGKVCNKCKQWKPLEEFNKNKIGKYGRQSKCRECQKECNKQWRENNKEYDKQWYENNKEHRKEYRKQWYENNKEHMKEYNKEHMKQWRENNKEHKKEYDKQWRENNPNYDKQWRENNKEKIVEYHRQYREANKENNLQYISNIVEQINPVMKDLPVYGYIYKFENIKTGRVYIGQTTRPLNRRYSFEGGIIKSWIKDRKHYQNQKFLDELIEEDIILTELFDVGCCEYHLNALEVYWINRYDSCNNGYNNNYGNHITDDGLEEFIEILEQHNLEFIDGQIVKKAN